MSDTKTELPIIKPMNFWLQLALFLITGTLWEPFYNMFCFLGLNKLDNYPRPEGFPSTKNSVAMNALLTLTIIGAPYVFYKRYKLLREYIAAFDTHSPLPAEINEQGEKVAVLRPNVIEPKKFVGYAVTTFIMIGVLITTFYFSIVNIIEYLANYDPLNPISGNLWTDGAFMILLCIGIISVFVTVGFSVRTGSEEKKWFKAFNAIAVEIMKLNNITPPIKEKVERKEK
ncbi:MAG: hypothetical protein ACFFDW_02730 [Candidatus Thorarchaeota archaeon]